MKKQSYKYRVFVETARKRAAIKMKPTSLSEALKVAEKEARKRFTATGMTRIKMSSGVVVYKNSDVHANVYVEEVQ
jgi:hypothetical protein